MKPLRLIQFTLLEFPEQLEYIKKVLSPETMSWYKVDNGITNWDDWENVTDVVLEMSTLEQSASLVGFYSDYLNQPFSHELIGKYFKGLELRELPDGEKYDIRWEYTGELFDIHYDNWDSVHYCKHIGGYVEEIKRYCSASMLNAPLPSNLEDFIIDCERAGIELDLKEVAG
jgi:hypothetical protein